MFRHHDRGHLSELSFSHGSTVRDISLSVVFVCPVSTTCSCIQMKAITRMQYSYGKTFIARNELSCARAWINLLNPKPPHKIFLCWIGLWNIFFPIQNPSGWTWAWQSHISGQNLANPIWSVCCDSVIVFFDFERTTETHIPKKFSGVLQWLDIYRTFWQNPWMRTF